MGPPAPRRTLPEAAPRDFQRAQGLPQNGDLDTRTEAALGVTTNGSVTSSGRDATDTGHTSRAGYANGAGDNAHMAPGPQRGAAPDGSGSAPNR